MDTGHKQHWRNDNWGAAARIGLFIVGNEAVPEAEWWAMVPAGVSVHAARVTAGTPWANWNSQQTEVQLANDLQHGAEQFATMQLNAAVLAHSSSSFLGGLSWDDAVIKSLREILHGVPVVSTSGSDSLIALRACGVKRPLLVLPPWFGPRIIRAGAQYLEDRGLQADSVLSYDAGSSWRDVAPEHMYAQGIGFDQHLTPLFEQICAAITSTADSVLIAGTGFRCVAIIGQLETTLGVPVITANQASLWRCLQQTGVTSPVSGYGSLFSRQTTVTSSCNWK